MEISFLGHSAFRISSKDFVLVTDPPSPDTGPKIPKTNADIVTVSHHHYDHDAVQIIGGNPVIIDTPGEYEAKGAMIHGLTSFHDAEGGALCGSNTIFSITLEGIRIAHLGDLGTELNDDQISELGDVDVLLVPVGGTFTLDGKAAAKVVQDVEPKIVIPMHFHESDFSAKDGTKLEPVEKFFKEMGVEAKKESKLKLTRGQLPVEEMEVVLLSRSA